MGTLCSEKISREKMVNELVNGKKFANQLQVILQNPFQEDGLVSSEDLVVKILRSFTQSLSVLTSTSCDDHVNYDGRHRRLEDSGESKKRPALMKDKRGCYKRKKKSLTWTIVSSTIEDGLAWRKYGQKEILNAKYPRSYFRCTHKYVQGCQATKQVQRRDDDPQKYEITYIGNHCCRDIISFPQIVSSSSSMPAEVEQEYKEETTSPDQDLSNNISSLDSIVWEDFVPFQSYDEPEAAAAMVLSCNKMIYSHLCLDMYNVFEHGFQFDECV